MRKTGKKRLIIIGALLVVLAGVIGLVPRFLSSSMARRALLTRLNTGSETVVRIAGFSIGWMRGMRISGVDIWDKQRGVRIQVDQLHGDRGLLALLAAPRNLGLITLERPVVSVPSFSSRTRQQTGPSSGTEPSTRRQAGAPHEKEEKDTAARVPFWDDLILNLRIEQGEVWRVRHAKPEPLLKQWMADAGLSSGTVRYTSTAGFGDGELEVSGRLNLPSRLDSFPDTLVAETRMRLQDVDPKPLLSILAETMPQMVSASGAVNGEVIVKIAGLNRWDLVADLRASGLDLSGGVLADDHPRFAKLSLVVDAGYSRDRGWSVRTCTLAGDPGRLTFSGNGRGRDGELEATGTMHLPVLFAQFPDLLKVRDNVRLDKGSLEFKINWQHGQDKGGGSGVLHLADLAGRVGERDFIWGQPLHLTVSGRQNREELRVDELRMDSSFIHLNGAGTLRDFSLSMTADLDLASQELGRLFDLNYRGQGLLSLEARSQQQGEEFYKISLQAQAHPLTLWRGRNELVPEHDLDLDVTWRSPLTWPRSSERAWLQARIKGWPGRVAMDVDRLILNQQGPSGLIRLDLDVDSGRVSRLLHDFGLLPPELSMQGQVQGTVSGGVNGSRLWIRELDSRSPALQLKQNKQTLALDDLIIRSDRPKLVAPVRVGVRPLRVVEHGRDWQGRDGWVRADWKKHSLVASGIRLRSRQMDLDVENARVNDWQRPLFSWRTIIRSRLDGQWARSLLPASSSGDAVAVDGPLWLDIDADQTGEDDRLLARLVLAPGGLRIKGEPLAGKDPVSGEISLKGRLTGSEDVEISHLAVDSGPLLVTGNGQWLRRESGRLVLEGEQQPDWNQVAWILNRLFGIQVLMQGARRHHYTLSMDLNQHAVDQARLSTRFQVDRFHGFGIQGQDLILPVDLEEGQLHLVVNGDLAGGRIRMDPVVDLNRKPSILTMPPDRQILEQVEVGQAGLGRLLARIHPLFGVLATPSGTMNARVRELSWPLDKAAMDQGRLNVVLDLGRMRFAAAGVLADILDLVQVDDRDLSLEASEVTCRAEDGRIGCTPLKILVADSTMTLSGSVGFDRSMDYLLKVPVTRALVGREGYRLLKGKTLDIPLRGTLDHPEFKRKLLEGAIRDLVRQAAAGALEKKAGTLLPELLKGIHL